MCEVQEGEAHAASYVVGTSSEHIITDSKLDSDQEMRVGTTVKYLSLVSVLD